MDIPEKRSRKTEPINASPNYRARHAPIIVMLGIGILYVITMSGMGKDLQSAKKTFLLMGTQVELTVVAPSKLKPEALVEGAHDEMRRVESICNYYDPKSFVSRLNAQTDGEPLRVAEGEEDILDILDAARSISELSEGAFDITFATVGKFYRFDPENPRLPTPEEIAGALGKIDFRNVVVDRANKTVSLKGEGTKINLGGIAKGSAVDSAIKYLKERGAVGALVNAGGDMYAMGYAKAEPDWKPDPERQATQDIPRGMRPWIIALQHPRDKRSVPEGGFSLEPNTAVVSSGDYERMFTFEGKRYHHIINPRTGLPATGFVSVTVFADTAEYADGLATALVVLGPEKAPMLLEKLRGVEALMITEDMKVLCTDGVKP